MKTMSEQIEWNPNSHTVRIVEAWMDICKNLKQFKHIEFSRINRQYLVTRNEFDDLIGRAEIFVNDSK